MQTNLFPRHFRKRSAISACVLIALALAGRPPLAAKRDGRSASVNTIRVPNGGIQPQLAVDSKGGIHLVYFSGDSTHGDLYYVRSTDRAVSFSVPIKVNSHPGSAIAAGNIRGAHLAIGKGDRVHVAWNGTYELDIPGATKAWMKKPMVYTRLNDTGKAFEPERNVIHSAYGLDGGGAIAADKTGNVYVFWHAPTPGTEGEENRRVWVARSTDDGITFAPESAAFDKPTGACGCCGMNAFADDKNQVDVLYRSATEMVHRDMYLLVSTDRGQSFHGVDVSAWNIGACTMSMQYFSQSPAGVLAAWETQGNALFGLINPSTGQMGRIVGAPGETRGRKYPTITGNSRGETMLAWTEGVKWGKGGVAAWQIFDKDGNPEGEMGRAEGVPAWSLVAGFSRPDGGFTIVY